MAAYLPPPPRAGLKDPPPTDDASMLEPSVCSGHLIPYHSVGRPVLRRVTEEGLRMAGVVFPRSPTTGLGGANPTRTTIGSSVSFSPGAKSHLPEILGGLAARGDFDLDPASLAATIALVQASPSRKDLSQSMIREDLGFKTPGFALTGGAVAGRSPQKVAAAGRDLRSRKQPEKDPASEPITGEATPSDEPDVAPPSPPPLSDPVQIRGVLSNTRTSNHGMAILARIGGRFAGIREALLQSAFVAEFPTSPLDCPTAVIAEAAHAAVVYR